MKVFPMRCEVEGNSQGIIGMQVDYITRKASVQVSGVFEAHHSGGVFNSTSTPHVGAKLNEWQDGDITRKFP